MPMTGVTGDDSHLVKSQHPHIHHVTNLQNPENIYRSPETLPGCQQQQKVALEKVRLPSVAVNPLSNC